MNQIQYFFIQENSFEKVRNNMSTILCRTQYVKYRKVSNISRTLVGSKIVDHSDVVGTSPLGAAPTTSSFST